MIGPPGTRNLSLARLASAGWLLRIGHGRYVSVGPGFARPGAVQPIQGLVGQEFFPHLGVALAGLLHAYGPRLQSLALFGSCARGTQRPDSDLDLLVVADPLPVRLSVRLEEFRPIVDAALEFSARTRVMGGSNHIPQIVPFTPEELAEEPPLLLDLTRDAQILYDPQGTLNRALSALRRKLDRRGARRVQAADGWEYWLLQPGARVGEVETL